MQHQMSRGVVHMENSWSASHDRPFASCAAGHGWDKQRRCACRSPCWATGCRRSMAWKRRACRGQLLHHERESAFRGVSFSIGIGGDVGACAVRLVLCVDSRGGSPDSRATGVPGGGHGCVERAFLGRPARGLPSKCALRRRGSTLRVTDRQPCKCHVRHVLRMLCAWECHIDWSNPAVPWFGFHVVDVMPLSVT